MKFYRNATVEEQAERRLAELAVLLDRSMEPPVPIDLVAELVLELDFLWEEIDELPGEVILGGLIPEQRLIVLNERHRDLFAAKPGLERSTKGHEMGHWDLFIDQSTLDHPALPGFESDERFVRRGSSAGEVEVLRALLRDPAGLELLRELAARADHPAEARAVNRYAAVLSMPRDLIRPAVFAIERTRWPALYDLAARFEVTISALCVRLEQLGLLYVDGRRRLHESRAAAAGQLTLL